MGLPHADFLSLPQVCERSYQGLLSHVSAGLNHSVYVTDNRNVYCTGFNYHGQTGISNSIHEILERYFEVEVPLERDETVQQVVSGKAHNLLLTSKDRVFFFGSVTQNQFPGFEQQFGGGLVMTGPIELQLPLAANEKVVRVKANFNRSLVWTDRDRVFLVGGKDQSFYCSPG